MSQLESIRGPSSNKGTGGSQKGKKTKEEKQRRRKEKMGRGEDDLGRTLTGVVPVPTSFLTRTDVRPSCLHLGRPTSEESKGIPRVGRGCER